MKEETKNNQEDFTFDEDVEIQVEDADSGFSFGPVADEAPKQPEEAEKKEEPEQKEEKQPEEKTELSDGETVVTGEFVIDDENGESSDDYFNRLYDNLHEIGVITSDHDIKGKTLSNEDLIEILEKEQVEKAKELLQKNILDKIMDDEDATAFFNYKMQGGKTEDFFKAYRKSAEFGIDGDISDSSYQEKVLKYYYENFDDMTPEEIDEQLEMLAAGGKTEKYAKKYLDVIKNSFESEKKKTEERLKQQEEYERQQYLKYQNDMYSTIVGMKDMFGVELSEDRRKRLYNMIVDRPIRLKNGGAISEFYYKLNTILTDPKKTIMLADIIDNDFDLSKYERKMETKVARQLKRNLIMNGRSKPKAQKQSEDWF